MSDYKADNKLVVCPYDEAHKVKASRLQLHISKCKLNNLDLAKKTCPFNATHLLEQSEFDHHLIHCPDRGPLDRQLAQSLDKNNPYKGRTALPPVSSDPFIGDNEEIWNLDSSPALPISSRPPPPGAVIEPPAMSKPAERKSLYRNLHLQHNETEAKEVAPSHSSPSTPRQPNFPEGKKQQPDARTIQNLGLGRGKSRIAANFNNVNSGPSYSNMLRDMKNLGLGRGQPSSQVSVPVLDDEDDFPALGCGRGSFIAPKQNLRSPGTKLEKKL